MYVFYTQYKEYSISLTTENFFNAKTVLYRKKNAVKNLQKNKFAVKMGTARHVGYVQLRVQS